MKDYRPGSNSQIIHSLMQHVFETGQEVEVPDLKNKNGENLARSTFAMFLRRIRIDRFPGVTFYTYTNYARKLRIGVRNGGPFGGGN